MNWPFAKIRDIAPSPRGNHSKTLPGRFIEWAGIWEGRQIRFTTEPKLLDTQLYFLTSSNARIHFTRDLGACYVDLSVLGTLSPESLERLRLVAQALDERPVRARARSLH